MCRSVARSGGTDSWWLIWEAPTSARLSICRRCCCTSAFKSAAAAVVVLVVARIAPLLCANQCSCSDRRPIWRRRRCAASPGVQDSAVRWRPHGLKAGSSRDSRHNTPPSPPCQPPDPARPAPPSQRPIETQKKSALCVASRLRLTQILVQDLTDRRIARSAQHPLVHLSIVLRSLDGSVFFCYSDTRTAAPASIFTTSTFVSVRARGHIRQRQQCDGPAFRRHWPKIDFRAHLVLYADPSIHQSGVLSSPIIALTLSGSEFHRDLFGFFFRFSTFHFFIYLNDAIVGSNPTWQG